MIALLASIEVLAGDAYAAVHTSWSAGRFGDVPPALVQCIETLAGHHQAALLAWNRTLEGAGRPPVAAAPVEAAASVNLQLGSVVDAAGVGRALFSLERLIAATYLQQLVTFAGDESVTLAGSILSVDRQHMAVLLFAIGKYPAPDTFASPDFAYTPR